jgi:hypothetical protein
LCKALGKCRGYYDENYEDAYLPVWEDYGCKKPDASPTEEDTVFEARKKMFLEMSGWEHWPETCDKRKALREFFDNMK